MTPSELQRLMQMLNESAAHRAHDRTFEQMYQDFIARGGFDRPCVSEQQQRDDAQGRN